MRPRMGLDQETNPQALIPKLMWNKEARKWDRRQKEMSAGEQGGDAAEVVHDHSREGGGALATLFKQQHTREKREI